MALYINTNVASLYAQNNLSNSQTALATSIQRLSSGLRINSAKDDAAGMAIAARMTSQIGGLTQAARNANDGISMSQTAEGALQQITSDLQSMRNLAVQAANGTNSASDRASVQSNISQLQQDINNLAQNTQYNGLSLLNGSLSNVQFQVGANANQTINTSIGSAAASAIGNNAATSAATAGSLSASAVGTGAVTNNVAAQTLTIAGNGTSSTVNVASGASAYTIAQSVNAASGNTNVTATASTTATLGNFTAAGTVSFSLFGSNTTSGVNITATMSSATDYASLTNAINAQSATTGVTAVSTTSGISLTQAQGYDIKMTSYSSSGGSSMDLTGAGGAAATMNATNVSGTVGGQVSFNSQNGYTVTSTDTGNTLMAATGTASTLSQVANIDVTSTTNGIPTGANNALQVIDSAINTVNSMRASLGALQNRFTNAQNALTTTSTNLQQARSRIQDTNYASATSTLTHNQILQQAGTAMLAQANAMPNTVLSLLK